MLAGLAPYFAASALSTSSFQSMPGSGSPSSTSRVSGWARTISATRSAAGKSPSGSNEVSSSVIGLPVGGPAAGLFTSMMTPGMSLVRSRISSRIWLAGRRSVQSVSSNWMVPTVSSVTSCEPCWPSPARA